MRAAVLVDLRQRGRWLLVFDNAETPNDLRGWLPGGPGHVLITSRERRWAAIATPVEVHVLARTESAAILQDQVPGLSAADADRLAKALGDLPLAVAQAAGFMAETGIAAVEYLDLLRTRAGGLLGENTPDFYPRSLAAATRLIADLLADQDPAAAELASLCAFLAPEPIPEDLFTRGAGELPGKLAARVTDPLAWGRTSARLARQPLARVDQRGLQLHRLTQAILRDRLTSEQGAVTRKCTEALLAASDPRDPDNPVTWPRQARLMPHLIAADLAVAENPGLRTMACNACYYLLSRGETRTGHDLACELREHWRDRLGDDDLDTLTVTYYLAWALREMGHYAEARDLNQDTLDRRRVLGEDHPDTLASASNLAADLRELGEAGDASDRDASGRMAFGTTEDDRSGDLPESPELLRSSSNLRAYRISDSEVARDWPVLEGLHDRKRIRLPSPSLFGRWADAPSRL